MSKLLAFCAVAALGVAMAPAAMADQGGTAEATLSGGVFTYDASGNITDPVTTPVTDAHAFEEFTSSFSYTNSLPDPSAISDYIGSATISDASGTLFSQSQDFGSTSLTALESVSPLAGQLTSFVGLLVGGSTSGTAEIGGFVFSYVISAAGGSTEAAGSGTFQLFGDINYSGPEITSGTDPDGFAIVIEGNPGGLALGNDSPVNATLSLTAVPEPASMALLGAALAGLGMIRRRRRG